MGFPEKIEVIKLLYADNFSILLFFSCIRLVFELICVVALNSICLNWFFQHSRHYPLFYSIGFISHTKTHRAILSKHLHNYSTVDACLFAARIRNDNKKTKSRNQSQMSRVYFSRLCGSICNTRIVYVYGVSHFIRAFKWYITIEERM